VSASTVVPVLVPTRLRSGWAYWRDSYRAMLAWQLAGLRLWLSVLIAVQLLTGIGFVLGFALFFDPIPASVALYVSTGVPVINLLMVGLVLGPQLVADQKFQGSYDVLQALPAPRTATAAAWYTVTLIGGVPPVVVSLLVAQLRYDLPLEVSPAVVPAVLLTTFTGTMLGYALAHALTNPMATRLITQVLVFVVFGFAPVMFPVEQMPDWLGDLNWWLPFRHMAAIVRASLTTGVVDGVAVSYAMVAAWGVVTGALAARALGRRR
jgi:ABC-2 type transport system permease protein